MEYENLSAIQPAYVMQAPAKALVDLRNSHWCVDKAGKLGMIGEINSGSVQFHYADSDGNLGVPVSVPLENLTIAPKSKLPKSLGLTDDQLSALGYA